MIHARFPSLTQNSAKLFFFSSVILVVYFCSLPISMAGLEISSWLLFLVGVFLMVSRGDITNVSWVVYLLVLFFFYALLRELYESQTMSSIHFAGKYRWVFLICPIAFVFKAHQKLFRWSPLIVAGALGLVCIFGFFQLFYGYDPFRSNVAYVPLNEGFPLDIYRIKGFFTSAMTYGNVIAILMSLCLPVLILNKGKTWLSFLCYGLATVIMFNFILSFCRGAWFAWGISVAIILMIINYKYSLMFIVGTLTSFFLAYSFYSPIQQRVESVMNPASPSVYGRVSSMNGYWFAFKKAPIFGHGQAKSAEESHSFQVRTYPEGRRVFSHSHNNFIQILADYGLIGFLLFYGSQLLLFIKISKLVIEKRKYYRENLHLLGAFAAFICFHLTGLTESSLFDGEVVHSYVFATASCISFIDTLR